MIAVQVALHGTLRRLRPEAAGPVSVSLPGDATVATLVADLGATGQVWIAEVNGEVARFSRTLAAGDHVALHAMIEGG